MNMMSKSLSKFATGLERVHPLKCDECKAEHPRKCLILRHLHKCYDYNAEPLRNRLIYSNQPKYVRQNAKQQGNR